MCVSPKKNSRKIFMFCTKTTHETNHCKTVRLGSNVRLLRTTAPSFVEYTTYTHANKYTHIHECCNGSICRRTKERHTFPAFQTCVWGDGCVFSHQRPAFQSDLGPPSLLSCCWLPMLDCIIRLS